MQIDDDADFVVVVFSLFNNEKNMYCYNKQKYIGQNIIHDVRSEKMEKASLNVLSGYVVVVRSFFFCRTNNRPKVKITSIQMLCVCVCKDVIIIVLYCGNDCN